MSSFGGMREGLPAKVAGVLVVTVVVVAGMLVWIWSAGNGACDAESVNSAAVKAIRPGMSLQAVTHAIGCAPSELPAGAGRGVAVWSLPPAVAVSQGLEYGRVAVAFDEHGAIFAAYTFAPGATGRPDGNGVLHTGLPTNGLGIATRDRER